jgi:hypothetical protein
MKGDPHMRRRILAIAIALVSAAGMTVFAASPASAASLSCGTQNYSFPEIYAEAGGQIKILGWHNFTYVGSWAGIGGTYRIWHNTWAVNGGGTYYAGAVGAKCNADNEVTSSVDLTQNSLTSSDHPKCGTVNYTVGTTSYTYIGSRNTEGDRFRYWGTAGSSGMFIFRGVTAARCD